MTRILFFTLLFVTTTTFSQQLWGPLKPGKHAVGFKLIREHAGNRPMLVTIWYPAKASSSAATVLFKDYVAAGVFTPSFSQPSAAEKKAAYDDFHKTLELPFVYNGKITNEEFDQLLNIPTAAKWDLPEASGKFPTVLMSSEPESLSVTAEYLASNGYVVAAVNAPWGNEQPADSLLWVQPTNDIMWLAMYTKKLKNVDQAKLTALGFGGGIQAPFFLTMQRSDIKALVNLEGGVFGPRSLTDQATIYEPSKIITPMLHIVTASQRREDDARQQRALVNTKLTRAYIQDEGLRHHDFSIFGRLVNSGLRKRGDLSGIADQAYVAAHKMILEFLDLATAGKVNSFVMDRRYMPLISLENSVVAAPGLVLHQPAMDNVIIEDGKVFKTVNDTSLVFDIYYPSGFDKKNQIPVVVFVNGIGSMDLHRWDIYRDWAKLVAAQGMIGVNYQTRRGHPMDDSESLLDFLSAHSSELAIDKNKIGLWACSANVTTGLPLAMQESRRSVKALAVYYGVTQPGPNNRFTHRQDLELQVVRAGLDFHNLNVGLGDFLRTALEEDLHFELINYPEGQHAFDAFDNTPRSREIILQTIDFYKRVLSKDHAAPEKTVLTNIRLWNMIIDEKKVDETLKEWKEAVARYREMNHSQWYNHVIDERNLNQVGYQLMEAGRTSDAVKVLTANQEQFSESANVYDALGDAYEKAGDKAKAVANAKKALEKLKTQPDLQPQVRDGIRQSAEDKIKRLK